ncbi:hypothetical protein PUN28_018282 [Cardiocondyla obscurior]|uniref:Uncharacterized protein n=1 Tax=Cardiocondyla obscurior TaxID=286306 RepID=A0AAW2EIZ0_9HYME
MNEPFRFPSVPGPPKIHRRGENENAARLSLARMVYPPRSRLLETKLGGWEEEAEKKRKKKS